MRATSELFPPSVASHLRVLAGLLLCGEGHSRSRCPESNIAYVLTLTSALETFSANRCALVGHFKAVISHNNQELSERQESR